MVLLAHQALGKLDVRLLAVGILHQQAVERFGAVGVAVLAGQQMR